MNALEFPWGSGEGLFKTPSSLQAIRETSPCQPYGCGPFGDAPRLSVEGEFPGTISVPIILKRRNPLHIPWFVVAIAVLAIQFMIVGWSRSHVSKEGFERIAPAFADANSFVPVVLVVPTLRCAGIVASINHATPDFENRSATHVVSSLPMVRALANFDPIASATFASPGGKHTAAQLLRCAADASAKPISVSPSSLDEAQHHPVVECFPRDVFVSSEACLKICVNHLRSPKTLVARAGGVFQHSSSPSILPHFLIPSQALNGGTF